MIRAVIDTTVWVAGLLTHFGLPARIVDLALSGGVTPVVSSKILQEYEEVLARPELDLPVLEGLTALECLKIPGTHVVHVDPTHLPGACSDPDDDHFLAAAAAGARHRRRHRKYAPLPFEPVARHHDHHPYCVPAIAGASRTGAFWKYIRKGNTHLRR